MEGWWRRWEQTRVFWLILLLHGVAILIFTRGFLLTRTELPYYSHCADLSQSPCFSSSSSSSNSSHCWTKPAVNRLVIIILDALRFDFVAPSTFFEESKPWMDKLRVLQKLATEPGSSARIFKAIADPPTTSLQRLKGLTTGGLPTFVDVGNSFGAPAIVEDNFIHQLVQNGKRVVMMGDDTWTQLFPNHFSKSYPYPSFNVKDLHTVDNGCTDHLIPTLYEEDWDVLIAHFLGVDHAGHIFGVDSGQMVEKLEQYNGILEKVIEVLESQSGPGGIHDNTFLLVMGDHGQTLNGDHGGGSPEEVETSIFAMSFKEPSLSISSQFDTSSCKNDLDGKLCINSIQQLDFAVTLSALLGIPFPFGSIGHVDAALYALGAGTLDLEGTKRENCQNRSILEQWMQSYANILCINSWQVKRYIDVYSASSLIGFSYEDLMQIADVYAQAEESWSNGTKTLLLRKNECSNPSLSALKTQIDLFVHFLTSVADLARSKWTEFNLRMMGIGFSIMLVSLLVHFLAIKRVAKQYGASFTTPGDSGISFGLIIACFVVVIRASSFLSNSYILEEGKVASFLLATTGIVKLRHSISRKKMLLEAVVFLLLISFCRFGIEIGLSKQAVTSQFLKAYPSWMISIFSQLPAWMYLTEVVPLLVLILLAYFLYKTISSSGFEGIGKCVILGTILSYMLVAVHWASESKLWSLALVSFGISRNYIPRVIYAIGFGQLLLLGLVRLFNKDKCDFKNNLVIKTVGQLSAWSSVVILLSGNQGPLVALASIVGGYCITRLGNIDQDAKEGVGDVLAVDPLAVTQWNLLAVCLFFCTGHWCAFDGLRYGAAFIGFDEFVLVRQAILLAIDTFGFSHILPIFALPFLVARQYTQSQRKFIFMRLSQVFMIYGLITTVTVTVTMLCVTIHRRHLMVWGLFAPKFVFDVVGLILTDVLICVASFLFWATGGRCATNPK